MYFNFLQEMLKEMVEEEQANKQQLIVGVENLLKEATTLSNVC